MLSNVTCFDFETTGLDPANDRVIEMAAIRIRDGEIVSQFQTIVAQPGELPERITEITGITPELMRSGMDEATAFKILIRFMLEDALLVAHNAPFDLAFLHYTLQRLANRTFSNPFLDTLTIARDRHIYPHKLTDMTQRYGIKLEGAHRALNDVVGCWELLKAMHAEEPVERYVNRLGYLKKYGPPKWLPQHAYAFPMENRYEKMA
jgi:DNA polymerase-3 subunit epsilon